MNKPYSIYDTYILIGIGLLCISWHFADTLGTGLAFIGIGGALWLQIQVREWRARRVARAHGLRVGEAAGQAFVRSMTEAVKRAQDAEEAARKLRHEKGH